MTTSFKKALLLGTALVAVGASGANAADLTTGASATWASAGTHTSASVATASASDNVNITTGAATLTVTNDQTATDSTGLNSFVLGNVTDTGAGVGSMLITTGSANDLTATIGSVAIDGAFAVTGVNANNASIATTITRGLSLGTTLGVTNNETSNATTTSLTVGGDATVVGATTLTAGGFASANSAITLNGNTNTFTGAVTVTAATAATTGTLTLTGTNNTFTGGVNLVTASRSILAVSGGKAQTITGALSGSGVLAVSTAGTDATIATASTVGTSTVAASTTLRFSNDTTSTTSITNNGDVYVAAGKTLTSGAFSGTGTYHIGVSDANGTLAAGDFGKLASGTAIDLAAEHVAFNVTGRLGATTTPTTFTSLFAATSAVNAASVTDNSILYDITLAANGGGTDFDVTVVKTTSDVATITTNAAADNVATVLDSTALAGATGNLLSVRDSVLSSSSAAVMDERAEATLPSVDAGAVDTVVDVAAQSVGVTETRLAALRSGEQTGMVAGQMSNGMEVWLQGFGKLAQQDKRGNVDGYDADTYGAVVGVDTADVLDDATLGLALSYGKTNVDSDNANTTETDIDSYQVSLYGEQGLGDGAFVNGTLAYGRNSIDQTRHAVGGVSTINADASYDSNQYIAKVSVGRELPLASGVKLTPTTGVNFQHVSIDKYTETGAGTANMTVDTDAINILELGVGAEVAFDAIDMDGGMLTPAVDFGYRYDVIGDAVEASSTFNGGGAAFKTTGADPSQGKFNIGASLAYDVDSAMNVKVSYDYEMKGEDYSAHSGFVRAGYKF